MKLLVGFMVLSAVHMGSSCSSGTLSQWQVRTLTWTPRLFQPGRSSASSAQLIPLLFQPSSFIEEFATADFTLLSASLSLPCVAPDQFQSSWQGAILPEVWIQLLPVMLDANSTRVDSLCQFFSSPDSVPGCQDWSHLEAWQRLRIFYDIQAPINITLSYSDYVKQCPPASNLQDRTWNVNMTRLFERWLRHRDPWNRRNATIPLVIVAQQSRFSEYKSHQVDLQISFWMDSEFCFSLLHEILEIWIKIHFGAASTLEIVQLFQFVGRLNILNFRETFDCYFSFKMVNSRRLTTITDVYTLYRHIHSVIDDI